MKPTEKTEPRWPHDLPIASSDLPPDGSFGWDPAVHTEEETRAHYKRIQTRREKNKKARRSRIRNR